MDLGMIPGIPIAANDLLHITLTQAETAGSWESRVEDIAAGELLIVWPKEGGKLIPIDPQEMITVTFGRLRQVYEFEAIVAGLIREPVALLAVRPSGALRSFERRSDVRVRALARVELSAKVVRLAAFRNTRSSHRIRTQTLNLSAGGFIIHHHSAIPIGTIFAVTLALPGERRQSITMSAVLVRCLALADPDTQAEGYELGFHFERISEAGRARILRFIFGVQREEKNDE